MEPALRRRNTDSSMGHLVMKQVRQGKAQG